MKITGIWNKPGDDGGFTVEVTMPDGSTTTASMEAGVGRALVAIIQPTMVEEAVDRAQSMAMAGVQVNGLSIVQKGQIPELMVVTAELGQLVLEMVDEWILEMRRMIGLIV